MLLIVNTGAKVVNSKIYVRVSIGTLFKLGLVDLKVKETPTSAYLLQYSPIGCRASCGFCLQSHRQIQDTTSDKLGRVTWPVIELSKLLEKWSSVFTRICLQTIIKPGFHLEALEILKRIREAGETKPFSLAITPVSKTILEEARKLGVDTLGVGLDTSTPELFEKWSKPYSWSIYWSFIEKGVGVFGRGNVYVHLIAGLGETLREIVSAMKKIYSIGGRVALFNYTMRGYSPVKIEYYRLVQIARLLLENNLDPDEYIDYEKNTIRKQIPLNTLENAFYTSGCPGCNRPFYNESPRGPIYNIPSRQILEEYREVLKRELEGIGVSM